MLGCMKMTPLAILLALTVLCPAAKAATVSSPDGAITVNVELLDEGRPAYDVLYKGQVVLESSPLGLDTSWGNFSEGLTEAGAETSSVDEQYTLPHGKVRDVHYRANELTARFAKVEGKVLEVVFRVGDRDVAFSYRLFADGQQRVTINREASGFDLPDGSRAWMTPQVPWGEGFMKSKPSYEEDYTLGVPVGTASPSGLGFTFPALFQTASGVWVLVSETGVSGRYAGSRLSDATDDGLFHIAFPEPGENAGIGEATVVAPLPVMTPWRTITIGDSLAPVVESTVATDLVRPLYEPSIEYRPGKATWSWLLWQDPSMNLEDQRTFIELAATLGYEYILVDAMWDVNIGREKLAEMVRWAGSKGVEVLLWYNSNGMWNDAPQTPRNLMDAAPARQNEMAWLQSIGVKGIKVDFFGGDKQVTMQLYEDILTDANRFGLFVVFHGCTLPRGWERMYPNFFSSEAITASENLIFSQGFADRESLNSTLFPFVRNTVAPMDYGPVLLNKRFWKDPDNGNIRRTTDTFQLATAVLYQSPVQHFGITPNNLDEQPPYVIDFLKKVPTVWDEIRYLDGKPGEFVVLARRSGSLWYVAATHSGNDKREIELRLPWLAGREATAYLDRPDRSVGLETFSVDSSGSLKLVMESEGGAVLVIEQ